MQCGNQAATTTLLPLHCEFPDEFSEFQARASTGGTVFGLVRRASQAIDPSNMLSDCNFLSVGGTAADSSDPNRRGRSRSLVPNLEGVTVSPGVCPPAVEAHGRTAGASATDLESDQDNMAYLRAYQCQGRRFSAACIDARDVTSKHNIQVSISPAPSSKSISSSTRLHDDDDAWALPVYRSHPPSRRTSEADIDRLRPPEWSTNAMDEQPVTYRRRSFSITPQGIVNEGDLFVAKFGNTVVPASSIGSDLDQGTTRSRASSFNSQGSPAFGSPALSADSSCDTPTYKVLVQGGVGVGKTALISQFMTSEYMGAMSASFDPPRETRNRQGHNGIECTVPVNIDGEDCFLEFTDLTNPEDAESWRQEGIDAFLPVYSVIDRPSFQKAIDLLYAIRKTEGSDMAVILVANKTDLMRARVVAEQEGKTAAETYDCKYIEVSSAFNHKVDELLVGIVKQIRLNPERLKKRKKKRKYYRRDQEETATTTCIRKARDNVLLKLLNRSVNKMSKSCDNLLTL